MEDQGNENKNHHIRLFEEMIEDGYFNATMKLNTSEIKLLSNKVDKKIKLFTENGYSTAYFSVDIFSFNFVYHSEPINLYEDMSIIADFFNAEGELISPGKEPDCKGIIEQVKDYGGHEPSEDNATRSIKKYMKTGVLT